jgi:hypothetical protein
VSWFEKYIKRYPYVKGISFFKFKNIDCFTDGLNYWRVVSHLDSGQLKDLTLIEMSKDMILLDMDDCDFEKLSKILIELKELEINYSVWETNRGYHIHIFVRNLLNYSYSDVINIRGNMIKHFGADPCKKNGNLFAIPEKPRFKTGKIVRLVEDFSGGYNEILPAQFYKISKKNKLNRNIGLNQEHCFITNHNSDDNDTDNINCLLFDYCCKRKLKENTGRGYTLCKNMSAYLVSKYDNEDEISKRYTNFLDAQELNQWHWLDYSQTRGFRLSCGEVRKWLRDTQYREVEEFTCWKCGRV